MYKIAEALLIKEAQEKEANMLKWLANKLGANGIVTPGDLDDKSGMSNLVKKNVVIPSALSKIRQERAFGLNDNRSNTNYESTTTKRGVNVMAENNGFARKKPFARTI